MYIYIYINICMYIYIFIYLNKFMFIYVYMYILVPAGYAFQLGRNSSCTRGNGWSGSNWVLKGSD